MITGTVLSTDMNVLVNKRLNKQNVIATEHLKVDEQKKKRLNQSLPEVRRTISRTDNQTG